MKEVYICYSKENKSIAIRLTTMLESKGFSCWTAPRDIENIENEHRAKPQAIAAAKVFLMILSKSSNVSKEVADELDIALENGKSVIPFKIETIPDSVTMRYFLNTLDWIDALDSNFDDASDVLIEVIQEKTGETPNLPVSKQKKSNTAANSTNNKYYIGALVVIFVVLGLWYVFSGGNTSSNNTRTNPESTTISSNDKDLVGSWKIINYEDSRKISAAERESMDKSINTLMQSALVVFKADKSFQRIGFTPQPQNGLWEFDFKEKKIYLTPIGTNRKEAINLLSFNDKRMVIVVVEQVNDNAGGQEVVTTKITMQKQM